MTHLPAVSGRQCIRAFERIGFEIQRAESSHVLLKRAKPYCRITVPDHKCVAPGTLRALIRQAGLSVAEFVELLK